MTEGTKTSKMKRRTKAFADKLISEPKISATQAYLDTHETDNPRSAAVRASELLTKSNVQLYMDSHIDNAKSRIASLVDDAEKDDIKLRAAQDILDRTHGKAVQRSEVQMTGVVIGIDLTDSSEE